MPIPSAESQLQFLKDVQALLEDGQFAATYKFALADIAVESGVDDDRPLAVSLTAIAGYSMPRNVLDGGRTG